MLSEETDRALGECFVLLWGVSGVVAIIIAICFSSFTAAIIAAGIFIGIPFLIWIASLGDGKNKRTGPED